MAYRFLVVDDTSFMRKMAADFLRQFGYEVAGEASNGKEAVQLYEELRPDVVMMDLTMPEMSGFDAIKAILEINSDAVVLICSASNQKELILEAMDAGAKGYLMKPFNPSRLQEVIRKYAEPFLTPQALPETASQSEVQLDSTASEDEDRLTVERNESEAEGVEGKGVEGEGVEGEGVEGEGVESEAVEGEGVEGEGVEGEGVESEAVEGEGVEGEGVEGIAVETCNRVKEQEPTTIHAEAGVSIRNEKPTSGLNRGNGKMKSFVSSLMCQWQEDRNGVMEDYSVVCTESENQLSIEWRDQNNQKQVIPFTLDGFRQLAGWLEDHLSARQG